MRKTVKIASLIIAVALLVCGIIGINTSAEEAKLEIDTANVAYNDMMHLAFTLKNTNTIPEGAEAGIIIWDGAKDEYSVQNASYKTFTAAENGKSTYYKSAGIAAPGIDTDIYVAACYKQGDEITITETPFKYSIVDYMVSRLNSSISDFQAELYFSVLSYGLASDSVLGDDSYALVKANGGYVGNYATAFGVAKDVQTDNLLLRANAADASGNYFIKWVDEDGNTVSTNRIHKLADIATGYAEYTAVYGNASESIYKYVKNYDYLETGVLELNTPDLTKAPVNSCLGIYSGTNMRRWNVDFTGISGVKITHTNIPAATVIGKDENGKNIYEFNQDENGNYIVGEKDTYAITENMYGDKMLTVVSGQTASGITIGHSNGSNDNCFYAEFDVSSNGISKDKVQYLFNFTVKDGTYESSYRTNFYGDNATDTAKLYAESSESGIRNENTLKDSEGNDFIFSMKDGEVTTIGVKLVTDADAPYVEYYVNGEYVGKIDCTQFKAYNANMDFSKAKITYFSFASVAAKVDVMSIDNVTFR